MCTFYITALLLCSSLTVLVGLSSGSDLHKPPDFRVLSPSEFQVILSPEEKGVLRSLRIGFNEPIGFGIRMEEYERVKPIGRVVPFSDDNLKLKKGDTIYYSMVFDDGNEGTYGQTGAYVFDGVFNSLKRRRREVYEPTSEEISEEEKNLNVYNTEAKQSRYLRHGPPQQGHYHHHHHHQFDHYDGGYFGHPQYPGSGQWKNPGHDHRDHYGHKGSWEDHDDEAPCDFEHKHRPPGGGHNRPWDGGNGNNGNENNGGFDNRPREPNRGGFVTNRPNVGGGETSSQTSTESGSRTTENPNAEIFTTRTNSTQSTTVVPNIDIRLRVPED